MQRQDVRDEIVVTTDLVALCRRLDAAAAGSRVRALTMMAEAYEAQQRMPARQAAA